MIDKNSFIPFHHYDFTTISDAASKHDLNVEKHGNALVGECLIILKSIDKNIGFSFVSVDQNEDGDIYMCVSNMQPFTTQQYRIVRTTNNDFLVRINHQYNHYSAEKQFLGKLPYHLYQLTKNTINNEQVIIAHSTLDALQSYENQVNASEEQN